ncbi:MAG: hypothetical protein II159_03185 [Bacteroidales bacterium]|nr:hypothetical protein [Bacteroidales bacterium]
MIKELKQKGIEIDTTYRHTLDNSAICHSLKNHGNKKEELRGQIPVTASDLMKIPEIISSYDSLTTDKNQRGQDVIIYSKDMGNNLTLFVEEIRLKRHELAASTMYKKKKG